MCVSVQSIDLSTITAWTIISRVCQQVCSPVLCRESLRFTWLPCLSWTSCGSKANVCWQFRSRTNTSKTAHRFLDILQSELTSRCGLLETLERLEQKCRQRAMSARHQGWGVHNCAFTAFEFASPPMTAQRRGRAPERGQFRKKANWARINHSTHPQLIRQQCVLVCARVCVWALTAACLMGNAWGMY